MTLVVDFRRAGRSGAVEQVRLEPVAAPSAVGSSLRRSRAGGRTRRPSSSAPPARSSECRLIEFGKPFGRMLIAIGTTQSTVTTTCASLFVRSGSTSSGSVRSDRVVERERLLARRGALERERLGDRALLVGLERDRDLIGGRGCDRRSGAVAVAVTSTSTSIGLDGPWLVITLSSVELDRLADQQFERRVDRVVRDDLEVGHGDHQRVRRRRVVRRVGVGTRQVGRPSRGWSSSSARRCRRRGRPGPRRRSSRRSNRRASSSPRLHVTTPAVCEHPGLADTNETSGESVSTICTDAAGFGPSLETVSV